MSNRRTPTTSRLAHDSIKGGNADMYIKIEEGLNKLRVGGNFEEIAKSSNLEPAQVWKRLSEMVDLGICFNTGVTHKTSSGRSAMVRQLTSLKPKPKLSTSIQADLFNNLTF